LAQRDLRGWPSLSRAGLGASFLAAYEAAFLASSVLQHIYKYALKIVPVSLSENPNGGILVGDTRTHSRISNLNQNSTQKSLESQATRTHCFLRDAGEPQVRIFLGTPRDPGLIPKLLLRQAVVLNERSSSRICLYERPSFACSVRKVAMSMLQACRTLARQVAIPAGVVAAPGPTPGTRLHISDSTRIASTSFSNRTSQQPGRYIHH